MTVEEALRRIKVLQAGIGSEMRVTLHLDDGQFHLGIMPERSYSTGFWHHADSADEVFAWGERRIAEMISARGAPDREYQSWFTGDAA